MSDMSTVEGIREESLPRITRWMGHATFLTVILFSVIWMFARVCYIDSAYQLFQMINGHGFSINDGRYGMVVSQLLPLIAIRLHCPLYAVMLLYSLSFVCLAYLLYLSVLYLLREERVAFCMVLCFLCMRVTFLHALSETFQLMFFAMYAYALLVHRSPEKGGLTGIAYYFSLAFSLWFCLFIHPVALFFLVFILLYVWIDNRFGCRREWLFALAVVLAGYLLKVLLPKQGAHDDQFLLPLSELLALLPGLFHFGSLKFFVQHFFDYYYLPVLLFVWTSLHYLCHRRMLRFGFYVLYNLGFFFVTIWIYHAGDGPVGMERSFLPMVFFCGIPFVQEVLPENRRRVKQGFALIVALLLVHALVRTGFKAESRQQAFAAMDELICEAAGQQVYKVWLNEDEARQLHIPSDWGIGVSSMLYSSCRYGRDRVCNLFIYPSGCDLNAPETRKKGSFAFVPWWIYRESNEMDAFYFNLQEGPFYLLELLPVHGETPVCRFSSLAE